MTEEDKFRYLLGDIVVGAMYNSPLRPDDGTPSFQVFEHRRTGKLCWKDYGLADQFGMAPENYLQHYKGFPLTHRGYWMAKRILDAEVTMDLQFNTKLTQLRRAPTVSSYVEPKEWEDWDLEFWDRFDLDQETLDYEDITAMRYLSWNGEGGEAHIESAPSDPAFIYWWNRNPASWKLYRPHQPRKTKFKQCGSTGVIEGWNSMQKEGQFKAMWWTSSTKDRLVLKKALKGHGHGVLNPKGEAEFQTIVKDLDNIRNLADHHFILYDDDKNGEGWVYANRLASKTGFTPIDPRGLFGGHKDPSDFIDKKKGNHSYGDLLTIMHSKTPTCIW